MQYVYIYLYRKSLNVVAGSNCVFLLTRTIRGVYNNTTQNIYREVQHTSLQSITYIPQSPGSPPFSAAYSHCVGVWDESLIDRSHLLLKRSCTLVLHLAVLCALQLCCAWGTLTTISYRPSPGNHHPLFIQNQSTQTRIINDNNVPSD